MTIAAVILGAFMSGLIGFVIGKYSERADWNKLIHQGILPKPKSSKMGATR